MTEPNRGEKTVIVLAMHGAPPLDFPRAELAEFFILQARIGHGESQDIQSPAALRYRELEEKIRTWPRTSENDPFYAGSLDLASELEQASGLKVIVGFNEFCAPTVDEALDRAVSRAEGKVIVITPMMTRGGEHSAVEIPQAVERARKRHPGTEFIYAWPFATDAVARFLASQISPFLKLSD